MKKFIKSIKKSYHKLKYLDKIKKRYFMTMIFISLFSLFIGVTYSYFYITEHLNAATIAIAKLTYTLSSTSDRFNATDNTVTVNSGETLELELTLKSLNSQKTKYALSYTSNSSNIKVYYSEEYKNNMSGEIGITNSEVNLHIIVVNTGSSSETITLEPKGGYLQNVITSNIIEGYFPQDKDIIIRTTLMDENLNNTYVGNSFPDKDGEYAYFKTECSNNVTHTWNNSNWELTIDDIGEKTKCDVYFKKISSDIETYFQVTNTNGTKSYIATVPNNGTYTFQKASCNNGSTATWDSANWQLLVSNMASKTICIAEFTKN